MGLQRRDGSADDPRGQAATFQGWPHDASNAPGAGGLRVQDFRIGRLNGRFVVMWNKPDGTRSPRRLKEHTAKEARDLILQQDAFVAEGRGGVGHAGRSV